MSGRNIEESRIKVDNFIIRLCAKECCSSCRPLLSIDAIQIAQMRMKISLRPANGTHPCLPDHPSHGCVHVDIHCKCSTRMQMQCTNIQEKKIRMLFLPAAPQPIARPSICPFLAVSSRSFKIRPPQPRKPPEN